MAHDLRLAFRALARSPGFTLVAVLALALGIGADTAILSAVDAVLLRPLPYPEAERVAVLWNSFPAAGLEHAAVSAAELADYRAEARSLASLSGLVDFGANLTGGAGEAEPERAQGFYVSPDLFRTLGVRPLLGRGFLPEEGKEGDGRVVLLTHELWRRRFGGDPGLVGKAIQVNGKPHTVVGVMPAGIRFPDAPGFQFPQKADLWVARDMGEWRDEPRGDQYLRVVGRLRPGVGLDQARAELDGMAARFRKLYPDNYPAESGWRPLLMPLREQVVGEVRPALLLLLGAVGLVLLIACANVGNLLLARAASRSRETAVRAALGAGRLRLVRESLAESLVLALAGGALGVLLAAWGIEVLARLGPADIPRLDQARLDGRVLAFALGLSLLSALLFGLVPALAGSRADLEPRLRGGSASEGVEKKGLRSALVVAEVTLALVLLVGAGLLVRSFARLQRVDPGFRPEGVLTFQLSLPAAKYPEAPERAAFQSELLRRLAALPGVEVAGAIHPLPLSGDGWGASFLVEGETVPPGGNEPHAEHAAVSPGYFQALGIPLLAGRTFDQRDRDGAPRTAIVDESLARRFWGSGPVQDAVGKRINVAGQADGEWTTVVGVVGHVRSGSLEAEGEPQVYFPVLQRSQRSLYFAVRGAGDPLRLAAVARDAVRGVDRDQPIAKVAPLAELVDRAAARRRFNLLLLASLAASALLLAALGLYGVLSYAVARRTREIGVRVALGADAGSVLRLVVAEGMALVLAGLALGTLGALALSRLIAGLLYGIGPRDPATYAGIALLLAAVALLACYLPGRRAARLDPVLALRRE